MDRNCVLVVAYDGSDFHGLAESDGVPTVMGTLRSALEQILQVDLVLTAAGRTDAGVHAWGQVVTGTVPGSADLGRVQRSINRMCGPSIVIRSADWAAPDFDARFSATSRSYRYDVWNDPVPNPLLARTAWHVGEPLDLEAMNEAAGRLVGEHDFSSFCRRPKVAFGDAEKSLVRILRSARWHRVPPERMPDALLRFEISASSFCHQMVRSIVGTLVDVGRGRRHPDSISATLAALDRSAAGRVAPPTGLVLWEVGYDGARWDAGRTVGPAPSHPRQPTTGPDDRPPPPRRPRVGRDESAP